MPNLRAIAATAIAITVAGCTSGSSGPANSSSGQGSGRYPSPIESDSNYSLATPQITGSGSGIPLPSANLPQHPYLAAQGRNGMHGDSYASDTHPYAGPSSAHPVVRSADMGTLFGGECATVVFDSQGRLYTFCSELTEMSLYALDPDSFRILAKQVLPLRASNKSLNIKEIMDDTSGGAYFHLDNLDRPVIATADRKIQVFQLRSSNGGFEWTVAESHDLSGVLPDTARITDAMPDWNGNYWFITREGVVGVVMRDSGAIHTLQLNGEQIQNSLAVAPEGVYIVSNYALYRFGLDGNDRPSATWRQTYDRGTQVKAGQLDQGSGTTPTLLDYNGHQWVAISDNNDAQIGAVIYDRQTGALVCREPLFQPGLGSTDNSFIGYGNSLVVENNYGYSGPLASNWTQPGVSRIDINPDAPPGQVCKTVWTSNEASQTVVPKLSTADGLVYLYTREPIPGQPDTAQAYYLTTVSFATGATVRKVLTGTGRNYNNNYAPINIGPNGKVYVGVLAGIISVGDR